MDATQDNFADSRSEIVERLRARRAEIIQAIFARIQKAVPDSAKGQDPTYREGVLAAVTAVLDYCLEAIQHGPGWSELIPPEAAAQARRAARAGVSLGVILRRYVVGHGRLGEFVAEEAECIGLSGNGPALHHLRRSQEMLLEHLHAAIEYEYDHECKLIGGSPEQRCRETVQRLLSGELVDPADLAELNYELHTSWHLGVIAVGDGAEKVLQHLKASLNRALLPVLCGEGAIWGWLGGGRRLLVAEVDHLLSANGHTDILLAVGEPGKGIDGWHLTHHQAREALRVAMHRRQKLTHYADSLLLPAVMQNDTLAKSLRQKYLIPLHSRGDAATLFRTLRAYIDSGCSATSASHALGVRRHTVESRRRTVEKLLGTPLWKCLAELDVALRLEELERAVTSDAYAPSSSSTSGI